MNKAPRFFCDNCGYEVGHEVKACPYCGRHFASVRCPACDYTGPEKMFLNGCPLCGYSASPVSKSAKTSQSRVKKRASAEALPPWAYIAVVIALLAVILFLSFVITR